MSIPPIPLRFQPIFKSRPWGGRSLQTLLGKQLPPDEPIGESWELSGLAGNESRVAHGQLTGRSIYDIIELWGGDLMGSAALVDGRFPLLIKLLDARQNLSIQVHPKPGVTDAAAIKHEAWYIVDANPDARIFVGLKRGVTVDDVRAAGVTAVQTELYNELAVRRGDCFYLPSGLPHALGAGVVVAEVQTPSDVTYRLYDWGRVGLDGKPRELHVEQALANLLVDVPTEQILQPRSHVGGPWATLTRLVRCESFMIDRLRLSEGLVQAFPHAEPVVWMILRGAGIFRRDSHEVSFRAGDTLLIPADSARTTVTALADCDVLEVQIPVGSPRAGAGRPERDKVAPATGLIQLGSRRIG